MQRIIVYFTNLQSLIPRKVIIIAASTGPAVIAMKGKTLVINLDQAHNKKTTEAVAMVVQVEEVTMGKTLQVTLLMRQTITARAMTEMPAKMMTLTPATIVVTVTPTLIITKHGDHEHMSLLLNEATQCFSLPLRYLLAWNQVPWSGGRTQTTRNSNQEQLTMLVISEHLP